MGIPDQYHPAKFVDAARAVMTEERASPAYVENLRYLQTLGAKVGDGDAATDSGSSASKAVVFIDDLDRCLPQKAVDLLESVKTLFEVSGFVFVLALDRQVIDEFVTRVKYEWMGERAAAEIQGTTHYVAKIIQIHFPVPSPDPEEISEYTRELLRSRLGGEEDLDALADIILGSMPRNWRLVKRLINAYLLELAAQQARTGQPGNPRASLVLLALNSRWPQFYALLARRGERFVSDLHSYYQELAPREPGEAVEEEAARSRFPDIHEVIARSRGVSSFMEPSTGAGNVIYELDEATLAEHLYASTRIGVEVSQEQQMAASTKGIQPVPNVDELWRLSQGSASEALDLVIRGFLSDDEPVRRTAAQVMGSNMVRWELLGLTESLGIRRSVVATEFESLVAENAEGDSTLPGAPGAALALLELGTAPDAKIYRSLLDAFVDPDSPEAVAAQAAFESATVRHLEAGPEALKAIGAVLGTQDARQTVKVAALHLGLRTGVWRGDIPYDVLVSGYGTRSPDMRSTSDQYLKELGRTAASKSPVVAALRRGMDSENPALRTWAAAALLEIDPENADSEAIRHCALGLPDAQAEAALGRLVRAGHVSEVTTPLKELLGRNVTVHAKAVAARVIVDAENHFGDPAATAWRDALIGGRPPAVEVAEGGIVRALQSEETRPDVLECLSTWAATQNGELPWRAGLLLLGHGLSLNETQAGFLFSTLADSTAASPGFLASRLLELSASATSRSAVLDLLKRGQQHANERIQEAATEVYAGIVGRPTPP